MPGKTCLCKVLHSVDGKVVQEFQCAGNNLVGNDGGNGFGGSLNTVVNGHHRPGGLGRRNELQGDLAENSQGSLRGQHETGQVVSGHAFYGFGTTGHTVALGIVKFNAHDIILGHPVFKAAESAGIFSHIACDGRHGLASRIRGIEQAPGSNLSRKLCRYHSRLYTDIHVLFVQFQDLVHPVGQKHDPVFQGNGSPAQVGAGSANGDGNAIVVACFYDLPDLFSGAWPDHLSAMMAATVSVAASTLS